MDTITNMTIKLSEPFEPEKVIVKPNYFEFKVSLLILAVLFGVGQLLGWASEAWNVPTFTGSSTILEILAIALAFAGAQHVVRKFVEVRDKARKQTQANRESFERFVVLYEVQQVPEFADINYMYLSGITERGEGGWWKRIDDTRGMVYEFKLKGDIITVNSRIQEDEQE